ncbi:hypothetical protein ACMFMG_009755 [Clarireedia jacksonii]
MQPSMLDPAGFWGSSWLTGQTKWQWKPPSPSLQGTPASKKAGNLFSWLMKWIYKPAPLPGEFEDTLGIIEHAQDIHEREMGVERDMEDFCSAIKSCTPAEAIRLCDVFNQKFQRHLTLGLVLASVSSTQLEAALEEIGPLIKSSVLRLAWQPASGYRYQSFKNAEMSIKTVQQSIRYVKFLTMSNKIVDLPQARDALSRAAEDLDAACTAIIGAEDTLKPTLLIESMVAVLDSLPKSLLSKLATSCSNLLNQIDVLEEDATSPSVLRYMREERHVACLGWLLILSKLEKIDDVTLTSIWKMLEAHSLGQLNPQAESSHFTTAVEIAELTLNRWITQGNVAKGHAVKHAFRTMNVLGRTPFLNLFRSLEKHDELQDKMFRDFFDLLYKLQKGRHSLTALHQLRRYASRVDVRTVTKTVRGMGVKNSRMAYHVYMHYCKGRILPESCVALVVAMIHSDNISSRSIWAALEIPIWAELPEHQKYPSARRPLSKSRINLIHKMATAFSMSKVRSPRVALRNVTQCWQYLSAHGVKPMPEMSRAIAYLGATRDIEEHKWVSTDRLRWVLDVVAKCEGQKVADEMDRAVFKWRQHLVHESNARYREANVLSARHVI